MLDPQGASVLVTGGCGFLGSHLVERLRRAGARVTVVDNESTGDRANLAAVADEVTLHRFDLRDPAFAAWLGSESFDGIFHLASTAYVPPSIEDPYFDFDNNPHNTIKLLETLRVSGFSGVLVVTSSAAVYGNPARLPIAEEDPIDPISPYGVGKLAMERYVATYSQHYGLRAAAMRLYCSP